MTQLLRVTSVNLVCPCRGGQSVQVVQVMVAGLERVSTDAGLPVCCGSACAHRCRRVMPVQGP